MKRQRGVALLTALLVVALASFVAVGLLRAQALGVARSDNQQRLAQAWLYAQGIDDWAAARLQVAGDAPRLAWQIPPTAIDGGLLQARASDAQGCLNLNGLLAADGQVNQLTLQRVQRLFILAGVPLGPLNALLDWLDGDTETRHPGGAEDDWYWQQRPPYRAANRGRLALLDELALIRGFGPALRQRLAGTVCVLPERTARVNLNSAAPLLLQALSPEIDEAAAQAFAELAAASPFASLADALDSEPLRGKSIDSQGLGVRSDWLRVAGQVQLGQLSLAHQSLLQRTENGARRVYRRRVRTDHREGDE